MLREDVHQTIRQASASIREAHRWQSDTPDGEALFLESLGISEEEKQGVVRLASDPANKIDPVVSFLVGATNGIAYKHLIGKLQDYPIPRIRLPRAGGKTLLDVGCSWGRWSAAAAAKGYRAVGIDPSLGAVMAARRVASQLGLEMKFVVGDARFLPFREAAFDCVFSYYVLQHFSREDVAQAAGEIGRVLREGGASLIQMRTAFGLRSLYHQARRKFREATGFEVRYWTIPALRKLFSSRVGKTDVSVDCFFGIGLHYSDLRIMPVTYRVAIVLSELLETVSRALYPITYLADSVYVSSVKEACRAYRRG